MEDNRLEIQLTKIQSFVDHCVMQTFNILIGNIMRKKECIGLILLKEMLQNEFLQITDNLSSIYMKYPALSCVEESYKENNFLWDSTFYDSLNKEQRVKYSNFDLATFDYSKYIENHTLYDEELPMFSSLIDAILYERYANYLKCEIEKIELNEIKNSFQRHSTYVVTIRNGLTFIVYPIESDMHMRVFLIEMTTDDILCIFYTYLLHVFTSDLRHPFITELGRILCRETQGDMPHNLAYSWVQFRLVNKALNNMVDTICSHSRTINEFRSFLRVKDVIDYTLEAQTFHNLGYHLRIKFRISSILIIMFLWKGATA